jgi:Ca2+-binding RTX toxin-like protein
VAVQTIYSTVTLEPEFQLNTYEVNDQRFPSVLGLSNGGFVVAYNNADNEVFEGVTDGVIRLDFYDSARNVIGTARIPYEPGIDAVGAPSLTQLANGRVVVIWSDDNAAAPGPGVRGAVFTASGTQIGDEFDVSQIGVGGYTHQSVTALESGGFVAIVQRGATRSLRLFDADATPTLIVGMGGDFPGQVKIAALDGGGFVAVWDETPGDVTNPSQGYYRIWNDDGSPRTPVRAIVDFYSERQLDVDALPGGGFAVAYVRLEETDTSSRLAGVGMQLFDGDGDRLSTRTVSAAGEFDFNPALTVLANGTIVVAWSRSATIADTEILARYFSPTGAALTVNGNNGAFVLSAGPSYRPALDAMLEGAFIAGWEDVESDGDGGSLQGTVRQLLRQAIGDAAGNLIAGDELKDDLRGEGGNDTLIGAEANDRLEGGSGNDSLFGGTGDDDIQGGSFSDTIFGGDGDDDIWGNTLASPSGSASADTIDGGDGDDRIVGASGSDLIEGGLNADTLFGGRGNDRLYAMQADDVDGSAVADSLNGEDGNDSLYGARGADTLSGGSGNDLLEGGLGADSLSGGTGLDTVSYAASNAQVLADLTNGNATGAHGAGDLFSSIENLVGSAFDDWLIGGTAANALSGGDGNDLLEGRAGVDTLNGGAGNDRLFAAAQDTPDGSSSGDLLQGDSGDDQLRGSAGGDTLDGGSGADTLVGGGGDDTLLGGEGADAFDGEGGLDLVSYAAAGSGIRLSLSGGGVLGDALDDTFVAVEAVLGSTFADTITGAAAGEALGGGGGDDRLNGAAGGDTLTGGSGNDQLSGGEGGDSLTGGLGADRLTGGRGADRFVLLSLTDSTVEGAGRDRIDDFRPGQGDRLDLSAIDAVSGGTDDAFTLVAAFSAVAGQLVVSALGGDTLVAGDVDGDGAADFSVLVTGAVTLTEAAFVL